MLVASSEAQRKAKGFTQRIRRKGGGKSETAGEIIRCAQDDGLSERGGE